MHTRACINGMLHRCTRLRACGCSACCMQRREVLFLQLVTMSVCDNVVELLSHRCKTAAVIIIIIVAVCYYHHYVVRLIATVCCNCRFSSIDHAVRYNTIKRSNYLYILYDIVHRTRTVHPVQVHLHILFYVTLKFDHNIGES